MFNDEMFDDETVSNLLTYVSFDVLCRMCDGWTLADIDNYLSDFFLDEERDALFKHMVGGGGYFPVVDDDRDNVEAWAQVIGREPDDIGRHLRALKRRMKRRKQSLQPTHPPATVIPFRPEDRPDAPL